MVDDEFILEFVNAAARARNPALTSLQGKPMAALYRDQPQVLADARRAVVEQVTVTLEQALRRYDRTEATQYARLSFVPADDSHLVVYMEELHSVGLAEAAVRESESRYASLVASLPDGLLLRGSDGRVLADTVGTVIAHEAEAREYRACRVCGQHRAVEASGRFPEHRIRTARCTGSAQFTQRWDVADKRRVVAQLAVRWSA